MHIKSMASLKPRKRPVKREEPEHIAFVTWFKYKFPNVLVHHSANGEARDSNPVTAMMRGKRLKSMGVYSVFYYLFIPEWFLFIEMKPKEGGYLSPNQRVFKDEMERIGYKTFKVDGCQQAIDKLKEFLKGAIPCLHSK